MSGVTMYPVTGLPPLCAGAVHDTVACPEVALACTAVGLPGAAAAGRTATPDGTAIPAPTVVWGEPSAGTSTIRPLPVSATNRLPAASTDTAVGWLKPEPTGDWAAAAAGTLTTRLLPVSETNRLPAASTANPVGPLKLPTTVCGPPPAGTFTTRLLPVSETYVAPLASTATPDGATKPDPTVVWTPFTAAGMTATRLFP